MPEPVTDMERIRLPDKEFDGGELIPAKGPLKSSVKSVDKGDGVR